MAGPHSTLNPASRRDRFTAALFDQLWDVYRQRVSYVAAYERVVADAGATFHNDHIAFRTFANQHPLTGIATLSRIFEALGYRAAGLYHFPEKLLTAMHYQHPLAEFPKLFISELKVWELPKEAREIVQHVLASHELAVSAELLARLAALDDEPLSAQGEQNLRAAVARIFGQLPWEAPEVEEVETVNEFSQYAAWVLVHGYAVNHFTSLVNSHGVPAIGDLELTVEALRKAGVPMKGEIEGAPGSKLRQTATEAVVVDVPVRRRDSMSSMPWSYAYFELAERNVVVDAATGQPVRFEGFLGPQATNLFEMTRRKGEGGGP